MTLACDKQATNGEMRTTTTKIFKLRNGDIAAITGGLENGLMVIAWYERGAKVSEWPKSQEGESWARLIILSKGKVYEYEQLPIAQEMQDPIIAWGSGRDFALGAMEAGATAVEAVKVASKYCVSCGMGVDSFTPTRPKVKAITRKAA
jgi:ATP-dependent HslUV protease subunit HslV